MSSKSVSFLGGFYIIFLIIYSIRLVLFKIKKFRAPSESTGGLLGLGLCEASNLS